MEYGESWDASRIRWSVLPARECAAAEQQDVAADDAGPEISIAAVIHVFGGRTSDGAVDSPVAVQLEQRQAACAGIAANFMEPAVDLIPGEPLARVFDHLVAKRDRLRCVDAPAVNARTAHA
jgi:hypothetical protein